MICGKETQVILFGKLPDDKKAPMGVCTGDICDECREKLKSGYAAVMEVKNECHGDFINKEDVMFTGRYVFMRREILGENGNRNIVVCGKDTMDFLVSKAKEVQDGENNDH